MELGVSAEDQTLVPLLEKHRGVVIDVVADLQQQQPQRSRGAEGGEVVPPPSGVAPRRADEKQGGRSPGREVGLRARWRLESGERE